MDRKVVVLYAIREVLNLAGMAVALFGRPDWSIGGRPGLPWR